MGKEDGVAILITLIALSIFSLLSLSMVINATTELKISDNHESQIQARYAAQAGINHARELLRGIRFDDCLKGPDGIHSNSSSYLAQARVAGFRSFIGWYTARSLDVMNPAGEVSFLPDDGLINTGKFGTTHGTLLIPATGIAQTSPNPRGAGTITTSRYFVKVTDNNGEASELAGDPANDPFVDGDGIVLVRSVGVAPTIREGGGGTMPRNSVAVFEARFKRRGTFKLDAPLVLQGEGVLTNFSGGGFDIQGGLTNVGIATIDTNTTDETVLEAQVIGSLGGKGSVKGKGLNPSVADITGAVSAAEDKALLLSKQYLHNFVTVTAPQFADTVYDSDQTWSAGSAPDLGTYNPALPASDAIQAPKVIIVNGDLSVSGNVTGAGVLIVRGNFSATGAFSYYGVILCIGSGSVDFGDLNRGIFGGLYAVKLTNTGGVLSFGTPSVKISGESKLGIENDALAMGLSLLPTAQVGFREITSGTDP
jgi:hypothetical protein